MYEPPPATSAPRRSDGSNSYPLSAFTLCYTSTQGIIAYPHPHTHTPLSKFTLSIAVSQMGPMSFSATMPNEQMFQPHETGPRLNGVYVVIHQSETMPPGSLNGSFGVLVEQTHASGPLCRIANASGRP